MDVHIVGRHTVHDRKIEPGECYTQLRPLWSSQYNDSTLRYLREKNVLEPASSVAGIEELKQDPASAAYQLAAAWLTPQRSARPTTDTGSSGITGVAPSTSDGSWFLAQPKMWVEGIDAVSQPSHIALCLLCTRYISAHQRLCPAACGL